MRQMAVSTVADIGRKQAPANPLPILLLSFSREDFKLHSLTQECACVWCLGRFSSYSPDLSFKSPAPWNHLQFGQSDAKAVVVE